MKKCENNHGNDNKKNKLYIYKKKKLKKYI